MRGASNRFKAVTAQVSRQASRGVSRNESNEMSRVLNQTTADVVPRLKLPEKVLHRHKTSN